ncbi:hypothetical protein [Streptomyces rubrogriseus]|uniref:hypothetical protein n=1 Tax=Streptomyces rubrogriseus TaxID=194673 RepID=UPI0037D11DA6
MLEAALHRVLTITQTSMGNVQLAESGRLHLARHTGLNKYFTDYFAFVDALTTSRARAASTRQQVTVQEVGTAAVVDEASRHAILQTGSRAAHSHPPDQRQGPRADAPWPTSPGLSSPRRSRREPTSAAGCHGTGTPSSSTPWNTSTLKPSAPPTDPPHRRPPGSPRLACTVLRIRLAAGSIALMESELVVEGGVDVARNASVR